MKITSHLDHISHCNTASGTNWSNRWTCRVSNIKTRRDWKIAMRALGFDVEKRQVRDVLQFHPDEYL